MICKLKTSIKSRGSRKIDCLEPSDLLKLHFTAAKKMLPLLILLYFFQQWGYVRKSQAVLVSGVLQLQELPSMECQETKYIVPHTVCMIV